MAKKKNLIIYKDEFIRLYNEGNSIRKIAEMYDISKGSVSSILKKYIELRPKSSIVGKEEEAYSLYLKGYSPNQICKNLNIGYSALTIFLAKEHGISTETNQKYIELLPYFKKDYENGMSLTEIGKKYGIHRATVYNYLIQEKVSMRTYSETSKKYYYNEEYLDELNSEKAYQLGIIFELGKIYIGNNTHVIKLASKNYTDFIFKAINGITERTEENFSEDAKTGVQRLEMNSEKLYNQLLNYGIKSNKLNIPKGYLDSFISGYFSCALRVGSRHIYISLNKPFENDIKEYLTNELNISKLTTGSSSVIVYNKDGMLKLINKFPEIKEKIEEYLKKNPNNTYWRNLI